MVTFRGRSGAGTIATDGQASAPQPDPAFRGWLLVGGWFLLLAMVSRAATWGDPNFHDDELVYFYIAQRMHDGLLLYVDIWDRKPPGLFALYYLFAGISRSVLSYQLGSWLCAALTALTIARIGARMDGRLTAGPGEVLAGSLYLAMLLLIGGRSGQAGVFLNLFMGWAVLLVLRGRDRLRQGQAGAAIFAAMACAGLAITIKQTAFFEGAFLGGFALWQLRGAGAGPKRLLVVTAALALTGAAPMLAWAVGYAACGHFAEFWHAMVLSNLSKAYDPGHDLAVRFGVLALLLSPAGLFAVAGWAGGGGRREGWGQVFCLGWLVAAIAGAAAVPNMLDHYALPLLVPLTVASAPYLRRSRLGALACVAVILAIFIRNQVWDLSRAQRSAAMMSDLVGEIEARDPHLRLLVYDGPVYLYALTGSHPTSPLVLPLHLSYLPERNTSFLDTEAEFRRILAGWPSVVAIRRRDGEANLLNPQTRALVIAYVAAHCRWHLAHALIDGPGESMLDIHGGCGPWHGHAR